MRLHLVSVLAATLAFASSALAQQPSRIGSTGQPVAAAQPSLALAEAAAQLKSDKAALERAHRRLEIDEAKLKSDIASGRMSAESKDAMKVYTEEQFVKGDKTDIATDKTGSLQMKADKTALQRALKRLEGDEATLKSDTASGRMSAESKDAMKVYTDEHFVKGEKTDIAADKAKVAR
jgi:hypothetical protein